MVYFDNAATSFPKPQSVIRELNRAISLYCGNPGRSAHMLSRYSAQKVYEVRELVADFLGINAPENICFTYNDTYAINMVLKGILKNGDHIIISDMEHNAVYRPIQKMADDGLITYSIFDSMCLSDNQSPIRICAKIAKHLRPETKMVMVNHMSNIVPYSLPLREIGDFCRRHKLIFAVDAAQSAGHIPINMREMNIDILCAPAHKGLMGIQGCGIIAFSDNNKLNVDTIIEGGSGVNSLSSSMPDFLPERLEAGTLSVPSIVALGEGIKFLNKIGIGAIHEHEAALIGKISDVLSSLRGVKIYAPRYRGSLLLFNIDGIPSETLADALDKHGICVRAGLHCAPLAHRMLGTGDNGAVRVSVSPFNSYKDAEMFYFSLKNIKQNQGCRI